MTTVTHDAATPRPARKGPPWWRSNAARGWSYASPTALIVVVFFILPLLLVGQMSASDWTLLGGNKGINFPDNFTKLPSNQQLGPAITFTLKYTAITTVVIFVLAMLLALLVQNMSKWNNLLRTAILIPSALGLASASLLFWGLYSPTIGPLNPMLQALGIIDEPIAFLGTPTAALWSTIALIVWRFTGFYMLLLMVGLQGIPGDVYEAADLDGANRWQTFWRITIPLLRPTLALSLILSVTGSLLAFDQFYILTKGGPDGSTLTIVQVIYSQAFARRDLGGAAALSVIVLLVLVIINIVQFILLRSPEEDR